MKTCLQALSLVLFMMTISLPVMSANKSPLSATEFMNTLTEANRKNFSAPPCNCNCDNVRAATTAPNIPQTSGSSTPYYPFALTHSTAPTAPTQKKPQENKAAQNTGPILLGSNSNATNSNSTSDGWVIH